MMIKLPARVKPAQRYIFGVLIAGLLAALTVFSASAVTPHGFDDFESGDLDGGSGWDDDSWIKSGSAEARTKENPIQGSWHVRIRKNGAMERAIDLTGESDVFLSFWLKAKGFGG